MFLFQTQKGQNSDSQLFIQPASFKGIDKWVTYIIDFRESSNDN